MAKQPKKDGTRLEKNIYSESSGASFRVRLKLGVIKVDKTFDRLDDARAYRDRMKASAALDPAFAEVMMARERKRDALQVTLANVIDKYMAEVTPTKKGATSERYSLACLRRRKIATYPVRMVGRDQVLELVSQLRQEGSSETTVRKYLMLLSGIFTVAVKRWGMELDNPVRRIEVPRPLPGRDRRLLPGELDALIALAKKGKSPQMADLIHLAVETGMRFGELTTLVWRHVDLTRRTAHLPKTKNGEPRTVPLSTTAVRILEGLKNIRKLKDDRVFWVWRAGDSIWHTWKLLLKRARAEYLARCATDGVEPHHGMFMNLRFHDLRHEAVTRMFEKGLNVIETASISGHKTMQMLKRYTHLQASELAKKLG